MKVSRLTHSSTRRNHSRSRELPALLAKGRSVDWFVVEYNPFGFGRWGYCPWLVSMLRHLKGSRQCRVAVMFHETQVPSRPFQALDHAPVAEPATSRLVSPGGCRSSSRQLGGSRKSRRSPRKQSVTIFRLARICPAPSFLGKPLAKNSGFPLIHWCWECSVPHIPVV